MKVEVNLRLIRSLRETSRKSISDVASVLGYKTPSGYWNLEQGQRTVSVEGLYRLAKLYNMSMEDLLIVREDMPSGNAPDELIISSSEDTADVCIHAERIRR